MPVAADPNMNDVVLGAGLPSDLLPPNSNPPLLAVLCALAGASGCEVTPVKLPMVCAGIVTAGRVDVTCVLLL